MFSLEKVNYSWLCCIYEDTRGHYDFKNTAPLKIPLKCSVFEEMAFPLTVEFK